VVSWLESGIGEAVGATELILRIPRR
jgi:hypothetical protein